MLLVSLLYFQNSFFCEFIYFHLVSENLIAFLLLDPNAQEIKDIYGLRGQIEHKIAFLRTHVPKEMKLVVIGHSVGCYISLQILKHAPELPVSMPQDATGGAWLCAWTRPPPLFLPFVSCLIDK